MAEEVIEVAMRKKSKHDDLASDNPSNKKETVDERKKTLLREIRSLKCLITQTEFNMNLKTFNDLLMSEISDNAKTLLKRKFNMVKLIDTDVLERNELYAFAGAACKSMQQDQGFTFSFQNFNGSSYRNEFWVQYMNVNGQQRLGNSKLPIGIFKEEIFARYITDSTVNVRGFLKELKQHIECYGCRLQQFKELQNFLKSSNHWNCSIDSSLEYTKIIVSFIKARNSDSNSAQVIRAYLIYKSVETIPFKCIVDNDGDIELSVEKENEYKALFRVFKVHDLKTATMKILSSPESPFFRNIEADTDEIIEINGDKNNDLDTSLSRILSKKSKNEKVIKNKNTANVENEEQSEDDLSIIDENCSGDLSDASVHKDPEKKTRKRNVVTKANTGKTKNLKSKPKKRIPLKERSKIDTNSAVDTSNVRGTKLSLRNIKLPEWVKPQSGGIPLDVNANRDPKSKFNTPRGNTRSEVLCSTPITGPIVAISNVAQEDISAIFKVDAAKPKQFFTKKDIKVSHENRNAIHENESHDSDSVESDGDNMEIDNNTVELLNDLQSIMKNKASNSNATTAKTTFKRKKLPLAGGKTKIVKKY